MTNKPPRITKSDLHDGVVTIRRHALDGMGKRAFRELEVARALVRPTIVEPSRNPNTGEPQWRYVRGDLAVVFCPRRMQVVTVLLRRTDQWTDEDARNR